MSRALRVSVPLNAMCSSMCETPMTSCISLRAPAFTHTPSIALSSCGIGSVTTVKPLESLEISGFMVVELRLDIGAHQALVGGQNSEIFVCGIEPPPAAPAGPDACPWRAPRRRGTWPDGRWKARPPGRLFLQCYEPHGGQPPCADQSAGRSCGGFPGWSKGSPRRCNAPRHISRQARIQLEVEAPASGRGRNRPSARRTHGASRFAASNSARSKLLATWMSIDGLSEGCTAPDS